MQIAMRKGSGGRFSRILPAIGCLLLLATSLQASQQPLFWAVERDGKTAGHLLGTIHSEDPRVLDFSPSFLEILTGSRVFAMELVPDLPTLAALAGRMQLPDGQSLEDLAGQRRFATLVRAMEPYGISRTQASTLQPWAAMMTLSVPPPRTGLFMDFSLSLRASGAGAKVVGLETLDQQLDFLETMDLEEQLALLDHAMLESERVAEMHDHMVGLYLDDDLEKLFREALEQMQAMPESARRAFIEQGIDQRNRGMLDSALPLLEAGDAFIAVGAMHLPGKAGLIKLLRERGYTLRPAGWPFNEAR